MRPALVLLPFLAYVRFALQKGVRTPALAFTLSGAVFAWRVAARIPWYGARLLAHEWWHDVEGKKNADHAPWWTFRVECWHALRLRDPAGLVERSRAWREMNGL